jgi:type I restriction enzyme S subunit
MTLKAAMGPNGLIIDGDWVESKDQNPDGDVRLIQLADIGDGNYLNKSARFLTSSKARELRCTMLRPGDVLISRMADPIGRACIFPGDPKPCVTVVDICVARPDGQFVVSDWLKYAINEPRFRATVLSRAVGATRPRVSGKNLQAMTVNVPSLDEQMRLVDLLSRAENIVRMRRDAEQKAKEIIPALFLDMFGDPATNPNGWPLKRLGTIVERFEGGKNVQAGAATDSEFRILKISAVTSGVYSESEAKPAPRDFVPPAHYFVRSGDLLFSRANTEALVGATAMVTSTDGKSLLPDKLWRLVWRSGHDVMPAYMLSLLQNRSVRQALSKIASGTGGSMKNISQAKLADLHLPIAPGYLQRAFDERAASVRSLSSGAARAGEVAGQAFRSLLAGVFGESGAKNATAE